MRLTATIARFISLHLAQCSKELMAESTWLLRRNGLISSEVVFIDGTKIEANANKYTFVWKKTVSKNQARMLAKVAELIAECEESYDIRVAYNDRISLKAIKRLVKQLKKVCRKERVVFVCGKGKRKTALQRSVEQAEEYLQRMKDYVYKLHVCGDRNSYSKTDHDATFMRMKEDAMLNGQLKPAYNVQHAVDAGYESEENYLYLENNGQTSYIKPTNYEISKTRKYRTDISRRENMSYDKETDSYTYKNGKKLIVCGTRRSRTASGYVTVSTIYRCSECSGCPFKGKSIKGNNCNTPMEERSKVLYVSKTKEEKRAENLERILSDYGTQLRMNRSIQAESVLVAIAYNINKRHWKIQSQKSGIRLYDLKKTA